MGDYSSGADDGESPSGQTTDAAGAPPVERQADADDPTIALEGTDAAARAGAPPADATTDPALDATATAADELDPLASATPLTYTVNGESRTFDGIKVLGEHGAIIEPQALDLLQRRLGERDHLYETTQRQHDAVANYERLSAWHTTDANGNEQTVSGPEGLMTMRVEHGKLAGAFSTLASIFQPDAQGRYPKLANLVAVNEQGQIMPDPHALQALLTESDLAELRAQQTVREQLGRSFAPQTTTNAPTIDVAANAPQVIDAALAQGHVPATALTPKDREFLGAQLPRYLRAITPEDRRANPMLPASGQIVDAAFAQVVKDRADLRAEMATTAKATTTAAAENAKKLAAAALGRPAARPAPVATPRPPVEDDRASSADRAWAARERAAAAML